MRVLRSSGGRDTVGKPLHQDGGGKADALCERGRAAGRLFADKQQVRGPGSRHQLPAPRGPHHQGAVHARVAAHRQEGVSAVGAREGLGPARLPERQEELSVCATQLVLRRRRRFAQQPQRFLVTNATAAAARLPDQSDADSVIVVPVDDVWQGQRHVAQHHQLHLQRRLQHCAEQQPRSISIATTTPTAATTIY